MFNHYYPDNPIKIIDSIQTKQSNKNIGSFIWAIREMELDDVDDFERAETSLLNDKNNRLSELEAMNKFSSVSNNLLTRFNFN